MQLMPAPRPEPRPLALPLKLVRSWVAEVPTGLSRPPLDRAAVEATRRRRRTPRATSPDQYAVGLLLRRSRPRRGPDLHAIGRGLWHLAPMAAPAAGCLSRPSCDRAAAEASRPRGHGCS